MKKIFITFILITILITCSCCFSKARTISNEYKYSFRYELTDCTNISIIVDNNTGHKYLLVKSGYGVGMCELNESIER